MPTVLRRMPLSCLCWWHTNGTMAIAIGPLVACRRSYCGLHRQASGVMLPCTTTAATGGPRNNQRTNLWCFTGRSFWSQSSQSTVSQSFISLSTIPQYSQIPDCFLSSLSIWYPYITSYSHIPSLSFFYRSSPSFSALVHIVCIQIIHIVVYQPLTFTYSDT